MLISTYKKTTLLLIAFLLLFTQSIALAVGGVEVDIGDLTPDIEAPQLNSISVSGRKLTPSQSVTISADILDKLSGVQSAVIYYKKPNGTNKYSSFQFNNTTQKYETTISVSKLDVPGEWKVDSVQLYDKKGNSIAIDRSLFDFSNIDLIVSDVSSSNDKEAPVLHEIFVESTEVNSGQSIKITADITDNQSGVNRVLVYYKKPSGKNFVIWLNLNKSTGKFEGSKLINQHEELGEWEISTVQMTDQVENGISVNTYKDKGNIEKNFDHCMVKIIKTIPDMEAPSLDDLAIELKQSSSISAVVYLTAKVSDELSGVSNISGVYSKPSGRTVYLNFSRSADTFVASVPIDKYDESGKWQLKYITATDNMENTMTIYDRNEEKYFNGFDINVNRKITVSPGIPFSIDIGLKSNTLSLNSGESYQLQPYLNYSDKTSRDVTEDSLTVYTSTDSKLVSIGDTGLITIPDGATPGYVEIGISYGDIEKKVTVKVNGGSEDAFLKITPLMKTLSSGQQEQIHVTEIRNGISSDVTKSTSGIIYTSLTPSLASVSKDGFIEIAEGATKGIVLIKVKYGELEGKVQINISQPVVKKLVMTPLEENLSLTNNKLQLIIKAFMSDGTTKDVTNATEGTKYKSSNSDIAQVTSDGMVTILPTAKSGIAKISVINNGITIMSVLNVMGNPEFLGLDFESIPLEMSMGEQKKINLKTKWSDGTEKDVNVQEVKIISSRTDRVNINTDGQIQAISPGASNIDFVYNDKIFRVTVKVLPRPTLSKIYLEDPLASQMEIGEKSIISGLKAEWSNGEISDIDVKDIIFSSSRSDRIMVTEKGELTALTSGSTNIEIKFKDKTIRTTVKVKAGPTLINIFLETGSPSNLNIDEEYSIGIIKAKWSNGEEKVVNNAVVSFTSSRPDRIKISEEGKIIALSKGTSNIEIKYEGKSIQFTVTGVAGPTITSIYLETQLPTSMRIGEGYTIGTVMAKWSDGKESKLSESNITFTSSRPDRILVNENGELVAQSIGTSNIDINYRGKNIRVSIKVLPK